MKKNKIIGLTIASIGVLGSLGGAFALYTRAANNAQFGISAGTYTGSTSTVTYKLNGITSGNVTPTYLHTDGTNGGTGIGGTYNQIKYEMTLGAEFASDISAQDYVTGNLSISLTDISAEYQGKLSIWVDIDGYGEGTIGSSVYKNIFMTDDYSITSEQTSFVENKDIAVKSDGTQKLRIFVKFNQDYVSGLNLTSLDEASLGYTLNVTWGNFVNFEPAYIMGNGNQWTADDQFAMAPNVDATSWQWIYNNLPGTMGESKCMKGSEWSGGNNVTLDSGTNYTVTWSGSSADAASYTPVV
jgi:hypothetical protein